jgi:hypothetical protein
MSKLCARGPTPYPVPSSGIDITGFIEKDDFLRALVALGI